MRQEREPARVGARARTGQWLVRAKGSSAHERHTLELIFKSTLAATLSWFVAFDLLAAQTPAFAPFSAVLMIQVTVYQSILQSLRYCGAVCAGVAVQAALGLLAGPTLATFVLVTLVAMVIGRWRRLGEHGSQVVTAAFFAFATFVTASDTPERLEQLGEILLLVAIGCAAGVLVNVTIFPPLRYRGAEEGVRALSHTLCDLLGDMYPALREGDLDERRTGHWRTRAGRMDSTVRQAHAGIRTARESNRFNPRRVLPGHRHQDFSGYEQVVNALDRVTHQVASLTRTLNLWPSDETGRERDAFLARYADLLEALGEITKQLSSVDETKFREQSRSLSRAAREAQEKREALIDWSQRSGLRLSDPSRPYGILLAEGVRLMDEAQHTCDVVRQMAETHPAHTGRTAAGGEGDGKGAEAPARSGSSD